MNQYFVVSITQGGTFDIIVQQSQPIVVSISSANGASGVTSVGLQTGTNGTDVNVTNSPITSSGDIVLNIPIADATKTGKLSSTDWSTFNGKQDALGFTPENVANKSTNVVTDQTSDTKYPSVKAVFDFHAQNPYTLQEVTDAGNTTTNDIDFGSGAGVYFNNGARIVEGTTDAGQGGNKGVALKCSIDYEYKWEGGRLYVMEQNGVTIRATLYNFTDVPTATDDSTKGFVVGSRWFLDNGDFYLCTDNTTGAAVWVLKAYAVPNLQQVTDSGNTTTNTINVDSVAFDLTPTAAPGAGQIAYKGNTGALAYLMNSSAVECSIGQTMHAYVHNADSVTIQKGQPVYLFGASGNKASVKLAANTSDATSAKTFGLAAENITSGQNGFIICQGVLDGINTGTYNDGDILYLGATAGTLTNVKPYAPNHLVYIGVVEKANAGNGQIYVRVQNGYELDEIHDVDLITTPPVNNDILTYVTGSPNLWKPRSIGTILGYTPVAPTRTISTSSPLSGGGDLTADRTLSISDAAADGTTKGAAAFNANDFNSASGVISLDYTNGQSASASNKGYLTAADWSRFNSTPRIILSDTGTYTLTGTTVQTIMKEVLIPANTFTSGVIIVDYLITRVSGSGNNILSYINIGSTSGTIGTQIVRNANMSTTTLWLRPNRTIAYKSATSTLSFNSTTAQATEFGAAAVATTSTNIDWTINQYLQLTLTNQATGDTSSIQWITITHYP